MREFSAVLFDLYDTLVWLDVERSNARRVELAQTAGLTLEQFMPAWLRSVDDRMLGKGSGLAGHLRDTLGSLGVPASPELIARLLDIEGRRLRESVHPYPETEGLLSELRRRGYRLGLVSNVSDAAAIPIAHLGLDALFDVMVLSHEVGILKPDPAIFLLACERLSVTPDETMFVADGGFGELNASRRLGIFSVMVEQDHQSKDYGASDEFDLKVGSLEALLALLPARTLPE
ncbi:MAG TPA: HAD-IA family hydrolase [Chloroflexota bacterium]